MLVSLRTGRGSVKSNCFNGVGGVHKAAEEGVEEDGAVEVAVEEAEVQEGGVAGV
jgi:hypothetical protein